ncbi:T9SS type A sorting domain-containing protein [Maribacter algarum]|uniref:T9SS type A sorting domain-containing protein n=1 Tax=Maribacter algarum (ex Zhang et al. 2020) TaxID=2578118 RepID=A0A5S3PUV3_9FLAO|nr:T9SS type A sorting domain-containing protein [Maribacter algarum]TMM58743.1 T9SS type A sorting domain-containing protein [Maribacter algarum]
MMKLLLTYFLIFSAIHLCAQSTNKTVIASAGGNMSAPEVVIGYTIGEPMVGFIASESSIDQGFWAGSLMVEPITAQKELEGVKIFPNPVVDELNIFTNNNPIYAITLFAVDGKRTLKKKVDASQIEHKIDLSHLSKGMYVLRLFVEGTEEAKLFKIIKK